MELSTALLCLASTLYFEGRSEGVIGEIFIADVVLNRVESKNFPNDVCSVVKQKNQFSYLWDGKPEKVNDKNAWNQALWVSSWMLSSRKQYTNSCHYHAEYVNPSWAKTLQLEVKVGQHMFYKGGC